MSQKFMKRVVTTVECVACERCGKRAAEFDVETIARAIGEYGAVIESLAPRVVVRQLCGGCTGMAFAAFARRTRKPKPPAECQEQTKAAKEALTIAENHRSALICEGPLLPGLEGGDV